MKGLCNGWVAQCGKLLASRLWGPGLPIPFYEIPSYWYEITPFCPRITLFQTNSNYYSTFYCLLVLGSSFAAATLESLKIFLHRGINLSIKLNGKLFSASSALFTLRFEVF